MVSSQLKSKIRPEQEACANATYIQKRHKISRGIILLDLEIPETCLNSGDESSSQNCRNVTKNSPRRGISHRVNDKEVSVFCISDNSNALTFKRN